MNQSRNLSDAIARLNAASDRLEAARQAMSDQAPGYPGSTIGGRGGQGDTQPERLHEVIGRDPALRALWDTDDMVRQLAGLADRFYHHVVQWSTRRVRLAEGPGADWCVSCHRDNGYHEPISDEAYSDRCRWCREWRAEHGDDPPLELLQRRHEGRRITTADVERALKSA